MLVLSRKTEQRIRIGDEIEIIVLAIEGDHVKIGIQAPRHITVLRYELVQDVTDENRRAASAASSGGAIPASAMAGLGSLLGGIGRQEHQRNLPKQAPPAMLRRRRTRRQLALRFVVRTHLGPDLREAVPSDRGQRAVTGLVGPARGREGHVRRMVAHPRGCHLGDPIRLRNRRPSSVGRNVKGGQSTDCPPFAICPLGAGSLSDQAVACLSRTSCACRWMVSAICAGVTSPASAAAQLVAASNSSPR